MRLIRGFVIFLSGLILLPRSRLATECFMQYIDVFAHMRVWVSAFQCHDSNFAELDLRSRARNVWHTFQYGYRDENETMEIRNRT